MTNQCLLLVPVPRHDTIGVRPGDVDVAGHLYLLVTGEPEDVAGTTCTIIVEQTRDGE